MSPVWRPGRTTAARLFAAVASAPGGPGGVTCGKSPDSRPETNTAYLGRVFARGHLMLAVSGHGGLPDLGYIGYTFGCRCPHLGLRQVSRVA